MTPRRSAAPPTAIGRRGMKPLSEEVLNEDLRKWFGKGKTGSSSGGGWDRYGTDGQKLGKCGDGEDGDAYAACLSKEKAAKLGPKGRAAFVKRKRADQKKAGDTKKGGNRKKGKRCAGDGHSWLARGKRKTGFRTKGASAIWWVGRRNRCCPSQARPVQLI